MSEKKIVIGFIALSILLGFIYLGDGHEWGDDFALYLSQAQAILQSKTQSLFSYNQWSMDQSQGTMGPYLYPPGYPLLLSIYLKWLPFNWIGLKVFQWVLYALSIWVFYKFLKEFGFLNSLWILFAVTVYAVHPKILEFSNRLMSDLWFTMLVYLFFYFLYKSEKSLKNELMIGLSLFLAVITRVNGILLLGSWIIQLILDFKFQKRYKFQGLVLLQFSIIVGMYTSYSAKFESNHIHILDNLNVSLITDNLVFYIEQTGKILFWHFSNVMGAIKIFDTNLIWLLFGILLIAATIHLIWKKSMNYNWFAMLFFILANLGIMVIWPFVQGTRYLVPLIPALGILFSFCVQEYSQKFSLKKNRIPIILIVFMVIQGIATSVFGRVILNGENDVWKPDEKVVYEYIQTKTGNSDVIAFDKPRWLHLATNRKCLRANDLKFLLKSPANYLLVSTKGIHKRPQFYHSARQLIPVKMWTNYILFKIER